MKTWPIVTHDLARAKWAILGVVVGVGSMVVLAVGMFSVMDTTVYDDLPDYLRSLLGIPDGASAAILAYNATLTTVGAATVAGLAIGLGTRSVASEEADRTLQWLLSLPISRSQLGLAKAAAVTFAAVFSTLAIWLIAEVGHLPFDVEMGRAHLGALMLGIGAHAWLYGALAFAIGAFSGNKAAALAISSTLLAIGWLLSGLLPLWTETQTLVRLVPWHWYAGNSPLQNGLDGGYFALTVAVALAFIAIGSYGLARRDLNFVPPRLFQKEASRSKPPAVKTSSAPTPRGKTNLGLFQLIFNQTRILAASLGAGMLVFLALMGPLYNSMKDQLADSFATLPPELLKIWDAPDMTTPEGFLWGEGMGMVAPVVVVVLAAGIASKLLGDEHSGRLGLLLSTPLQRTQIFSIYLLTMLLQLTWLALATGVGLFIGATVGGLGIAISQIVGASVHLWALGVFMGATIATASALSHSRSAASVTAAVVGLGGYLLHVTMSLSESTASWARISPFYYYSSSSPLMHGSNFGHVAILLIPATALFVFALMAYPRRDLRV